MHIIFRLFCTSKTEEPPIRAATVIAVTSRPGGVRGDHAWEEARAPEVNVFDAGPAEIIPDAKLLRRLLHRLGKDTCVNLKTCWAPLRRKRLWEEVTCGAGGASPSR
jgi:hypothetical protein